MTQDEIRKLCLELALKTTGTKGYSPPHASEVVTSAKLFETYINGTRPTKKR